MSQIPVQSEALAAALAAEAQARAGAHESDATILDYLAGTLAEDVHGQVQEHLAGCKTCAQRLLDLEPFARPESVDPRQVEDFVAAATWRELRGRIDGEERDQRPWLSGRIQSRQMLAASFVFGLLMLSPWLMWLRTANSRLRLSVAELSAPQINTPVLWLDEQTRGEPQVPTLRLPEQQVFQLVMMWLDNAESFSEFEVEIVDSEGREIWREGNLRLNPDILRFGFWTGMLEPGEYRFRTYGIDAAGRHELGTDLVLVEAE